ncbi:MAG: PD-(D/E)XK nuclease family protein [Bacteroidales bacterium]|nr:PD-(D/E)XK nuclease family protein [Candidatus Physcousia equi]
MNFLKEVSKDLLRRYGCNLSQVTVVFPGKRAKLFMNQYLAEEQGSPVWAPQYCTIDELFLRLSPYRREDAVALVCHLYNIYREEVEEARDLDDFFSWGEIILSDFDDIDKHMVSAAKVFTNARDLASISEDYLTESQKKALSSFFKDFDPDNLSALKQNFVRLWDCMSTIYNRLGADMRERGALYGGALYRDVAERIKRGEVTVESKGVYVFVGFNILDECEETLFRFFQHSHEALFYWDYDHLYTSDKKWEAGLFINQDRSMFPNALPDEYFDNLGKLDDITFIATSTDNAQCCHIPTWIGEHLTEKENETGIVLCDEHMLSAVLHCLPDAPLPHTVNVTMGYPLIDTPIYGFLNVYASMLIDGLDMATMRYRRSYMDKVCRHPYFVLLDDALKEELFAPCVLDSKGLVTRLMAAVDNMAQHFSAKETQDLYDQLYTEALFQMHLVFVRFLSLTECESAKDPVLDVSVYTMRCLIMEVLFSKSIPFHGEPAMGVQVMGLLETRNIDFRHLLMLNVGEGILPKKSDDTSLIPYALRESFGLTTFKHRISVFAYYFYRIISRAEHVTLMYNDNSSGLRNNEMSRFMRQLMAETNLPIRHIRLMPDTLSSKLVQQSDVCKTPEMVELLRKKYINNSNHKFSPSAINCYLNCSMQFFFKYVSDLYVDDTPEDGINMALMGTIFHDSAEFFYTHLTKDMSEPVITREKLAHALDHPERCIVPFVDHSFIVNYFSPFKDSSKTEVEKRKKEYAQQLASKKYEEVHRMAADFYAKPHNATLLMGLNHLIHRVLVHFLCSTLRYDLSHTDFHLMGMEQDCSYTLELAPGENILIGGRIDRLESNLQETQITVVDYKTGGKPELRRNIDDVFNRNNNNSASHTGYFLQTFLYAMAVRQEKNCQVKPALFYVNRAARSDMYSHDISLGTEASNRVVNDIAVYEPEIRTHLQEKLNELFDVAVPFSCTSNKSICQYCNYKSLCPNQNI